MLPLGTTTQICLITPTHWLIITSYQITCTLTKINTALTKCLWWQLSIQAQKTAHLMITLSFLVSTRCDCSSGNHFQFYKFWNVFNYVIVLEFTITCILGITKNKLRNLQFWINERQRRVLRPSVWNFLKAVVILQVAESGMFLHKSGIFWHLSLAFPLDIHCWIQHLQISIKHKEIHSKDFKITLNHFVHLTHISHKYKNKESERDKGNKKKKYKQ
jgi:hypothetical protein